MKGKSTLLEDGFGSEIFFSSRFFSLIVTLGFSTSLLATRFVLFGSAVFIMVLFSAGLATLSVEASILTFVSCAYTQIIEIQY